MPRTFPPSLRRRLPAVAHTGAPCPPPPSGALQIAFAITIIVLVADQLWPGTGYYSGCYYDYSVSPPVQTCGDWWSE